MKFIHISDPHIMVSYKSLFMGFMEKLYSPIDKLSVILQEIPWQDMDFLALTGDLIHDGGLEDYKLLKKILKNNLPQGFPVLFVMGNHDNRKAFLEVFSQDLLGDLITPGAIHYRARMKDLDLIVLDSTSPGKYGGYISQDQVDSLKRLLRDGRRRKLLFLHHPLWWTDNQVALENRDQVLSLIKKAPVDGVFVGHTHRNLTSSYQGIDQFCADSSSYIMDCKKKGYYQIIDKVGYSLVEVTDQGISAHYDQLFESRVVGQLPIHHYYK